MSSPTQAAFQYFLQNRVCIYRTELGWTVNDSFVSSACADLSSFLVREMYNARKTTRTRNRTTPTTSPITINVLGDEDWVSGEGSEQTRMIYDILLPLDPKSERALRGDLFMGANKALCVQYCNSLLNCFAAIKACAALNGILFRIQSSLLCR